MKLSPLGDQAILARFDDEAVAASWAASLSAPWIIDVVPAYSTVAVFFDPRQIHFRAAEAWLLQHVGAASPHPNPPPQGGREQSGGRLFVIPCCYELGLDLARVAELKRLTPKEVIGQHTSVEYTVFAIGFCPGFPYLGHLSDGLAGVPRLETPRLRVEPGSVGITGRQTGIYPMARPGGWNLIGRTPLTLVDMAAGYFALSAGDRVRFEPIEPAEYERHLGKRLAQ